jgi:hypothetical protein
MTNYLYYNYFYRYRQLRKNIKDIVDSNNFVGAQTQLNNIIAEFEAKFPDSDIKRDYNFGEKIMMIHAKNHLDTVIDKNDPEFFESGVLKHQSDIVREALLRVPKSDYSE